MSAPPPGPKPAVLCFGPFELDSAAGEVRRSGRRVRLQPQPLRVLDYLVRRAGSVVDREELRRAIWGDDTHVDFDRGLNFCVQRIRAALGDDAEAPRYIQTVPRRGYRFIAPVQADRPIDRASSQPASRWTRSRGLLVALLAAVSLASWTAVSSGPKGPERALVAVLPFESLGADSGSLADALTEELITQLGRVAPERLRVIARSSVERYAVPPTLGEVRRELGVAFVVEGSVRREGERTRVSARLVRTLDGSQLWSDSIDGKQGEEFALQDEVAQRVGAAVTEELLPERTEWADSAPRLDPPSDGLNTARALLRKRDAPSLVRAQDLLAGLVESEQDDARVWAALADVEHRLRLIDGSADLVGVRRGRDAARRAIELEPRLPEGHHMLGLIELWHGWDPERAGDSLQRALKLNPSSARAHHDDAWHWVARGRPEAAVAAIRHARQLDPISPQSNCDVGWILLRARRYGEAQTACRRTLQIEPDFPPAEACIATASRRLDRPEQGIDAVAAEAARELERARDRRLDALTESAAAGHPDPYHTAAVQAGLGRLEDALASLEQAFVRRAPLMVMLASDPEFDPLRHDPRFADVVRRVAQTRPLEGAGLEAEDREPR